VQTSKAVLEQVLETVADFDSGEEEIEDGHGSGCLGDEV
jgi:hypothetical protein